MAAHGLLSARLLSRNVAWNLLGAGLPLLVAVWAMPLLIDGMGKERFGLLAIIWMGVGYFSLFDLGIGRALTKLVAERLGRNETADLPNLTATGLRLMLGLGLGTMVLVAAITPWLMTSVLNVPAVLIDEAIWSFWILSASLPFVVSTAGQIGLLQAHQRFLPINLVRVPLGVMTFLGPVLALSFSSSLVATTLVLAIARIAAWFAYRLLCGLHLGSLRGRGGFDRGQARTLLGFGGWITVSNIVGPMMVYFDRFLIGSLLTLTAVAYYTTPYEIITRLLIIPEAVVGVLFPALATALAADRQRSARIYTAGGRSLLLVLFPLVALAVLFAPEGLTLWLDADFAEQSTTVLRWLAVGVFVNCIARLPLVLLQGGGRPDLVAKLHLAELIPYALALWWLIESMGIAGAAIAWTLRILVDTLILSAMAIKQMDHMRASQSRILAYTAIATALLGLMSLADVLALKLVIAGLALTASLLLILRELQRLRRADHSLEAVLP